MKLFSFIFSLILLMGCSTESAKRKKVIFFGDSITEAGVQPKGYIDVIQKKIDSAGWTGEYELIGKGISGNKVYDLFLRLDDDVLALEPQKVMIWIGVNDVWHKSLLGTGTDTDRFVRFYDAIIHKLKAASIEVYVCTPALIGEKKDKQNELDEPLDTYSQMIREIAQKSQLTLIDLRTFVTNYVQQHNPENAANGILTYDGVHLNDAGNREIGNQIFEKIFP